MRWIVKHTRRSSFKLKVFLYFLSFLLGYTFHYIWPIGKINKKTSIEPLSSHFDDEYSHVHVLLVVLIFSSVNNFGKRNTLRETWLSGFSDSKDVKYYFVLSLRDVTEDSEKLILFEQEKYNDLLIFINLEDSFYLLTEKLVASFGWVTNIPVLQEEGKSETKKTFGDFKFVLKCDDDSYVRLGEVIHELETVHIGKKGENLYWGFFDGRAKPKKGGKYKEDQWDICDYYIPYALGGGYVLAKPLVEFIAKNEKYLKKYNSEDISVGAWISSYAGLNRVHDTRFDTEYLSRGCHQSYIITHKHSEAAIRNFHNNLKTTGQLCQKEFKTRMSYNYNWQGPPSKCCARVNPNIP